MSIFADKIINIPFREVLPFEERITTFDASMEKKIEKILQKLENEESIKEDLENLFEDNFICFLDHIFQFGTHPTITKDRLLQKFKEFIKEEDPELKLMNESFKEFIEIFFQLLITIKNENWENYVTLNEKKKFLQIVNQYLTQLLDFYENYDDFITKLFFDNCLPNDLLIEILDFFQAFSILVKGVRKKLQNRGLWNATYFVSRRGKRGIESLIKGILSLSQEINKTSHLFSLGINLLNELFIAAIIWNSETCSDLEKKDLKIDFNRVPSGHIDYLINQWTDLNETIQDQIITDPIFQIIFTEEMKLIPEDKQLSITIGNMLTLE